MLAKSIACTVAERERPAFARAQRRWSAIATCDGFLGQLGGFEGDGAYVLGLWRDGDAYARFMREAHDEVTSTNDQAATYSAISVELARVALGMPGECASLVEALPYAGFLRVAECDVDPTRVGHFTAVQRDVWTPGMARVPGMLAGAFWTSDTRPARFLVTTLWRGEREHVAYARDVLPALRGRAAADADLRAIRGRQFTLEPSWTVLPRATDP
ncbi:MAG: DUF4937 domain-containing protein [Planctomycetes bacterium]|nr:DUF4937 domain-containing protein [Planctomycetota bacterium]